MIGFESEDDSFASQSDGLHGIPDFLRRMDKKLTYDRLTPGEIL
jgi:hypothetical protein